MTKGLARRAAPQAAPAVHLARSGDRRIGFAIRYIAPHVRQLAGDDDSAMLVRGVDEHHHFAPEPAPAFDLAPEARAHHAESVARSARILYRGTGVERFR
jgi:hypothetical protein